MPTTERLPKHYLPDRYSVDTEPQLTYSTNIRDAIKARQTTAAVVMAIADVTEKSISEIGPLDDSIDCDALNRLIAHPNHRRRKGIAVSFVAEGFTISLNDEGDLTMTKNQ